MSGTTTGLAGAVLVSAASISAMDQRAPREWSGEEQQRHRGKDKDKDESEPGDELTEQSSHNLDRLA